MITTRPRGTIVTEINRDALSKLVASKIKRTKAVITADRTAVIYTPSKGWGWLDTEGVGRFCHSHKMREATITVGFIAETYNESETTFGWGEVAVDLADLIPLPQADIDLADFIRTFGARLENNFNTWKVAIG